MQIGIKDINGMQKKNPLFNNRSIKKEEDLKLDKLQNLTNESNIIEPSCGELKIDTFRDEDNLYIVCQIPSVKKNEIKIILNSDVLTIEGIMKFPLYKDSLTAITQECFWGEFRRRIVLPEDVDTSKLIAEFFDGILALTIPIIEKAKMKVIEIS
ncbi:MAG: heat shock protein HSP20 family protein [Candidatus Peregrinibacteria bacterium GW2011_GWF2_33_10]|nr:MAG: heat shock protein HSP20 family protein [Candidatus Peregrinibacteria bacterium GW2011_GWF2_33_10]OGJ46230.1 MAG: hypothetical protein A2263_05085 [Candidatus Peregrinibacteria bacterium RIFOXYA2_FULL_33_21]OGJ46355.1 MAG: hypothetical protein A2272_01645 [Candidatus Peregrinibacteria bacterium RIFOXYA12_FULL_33_12]OGJ50923.1 MAG: hypothetical protein A2307_01610 [Candidatus Peregrinibacteria bacterium RIFOXYB2_FULL_33_20]